MQHLVYSVNSYYMRYLYYVYITCNNCTGHSIVIHNYCILQYNITAQCKYLLLLYGSNIYGGSEAEMPVVYIGSVMDWPVLAVYPRTLYIYQ